MQPNQGRRSDHQLHASRHRDIATNAYFDTFDAGDVDAVDTYFSSDLIDHNPTPGAPSAIDGMRGLVADLQRSITLR